MTANQTVVEPESVRPKSVGSRVKRRIFWVVFGVFCLALASILTFTKPSIDDINNPPLSPENYSPNGAAAVAHVLREHGIDVKVTKSRTQAQRDSAGKTLVVPATPALSVDALNALISDADVVVLIDPTASQLDAVAGATRAGYAGEAVAPGCDSALTANIQHVTIGTLFAAKNASGCFAYGDGFGLLSADRDGTKIFVLDGKRVMSNETVKNADNAALALRLLAQRETVVWYVASPTDTDSAGQGKGGFGAFTPPWVTPVIVVLFGVAAAAIWWRGRRFGPLVVENLPVTVRASETLEGRARLYARSRDAAHAAHILRRTAVRQLAKALGLGPNASAATVSGAVSQLLVMNGDTVSNLLAGSAPNSDSELMYLSDKLTDLQAAVNAAVAPEGTRREQH